MKKYRSQDTVFGEAVVIFQLIVWLLVLIILLVACLLLSKGQILIPEFCYVASFLPQVIFAFGYIEKYEINLHTNTLLVLIGGACLFAIASVLTVPLSKVRLSRKKRYLPYLSTPKVVRWKLITFIAFQAMTCLLIAYYLIFSYRGVSLQEAIYLFRAQSYIGYSGAVDYEVFMPMILRLFKRLSTASGYFWGYMLARSLVNKEKRNRLLIVINLALSILCDSISSGGRKGPFILLMSIVIMYFLLRMAKNGWKRRFGYKIIPLMLALMLVFGVSFKYLGELLGRTISGDATDYLSVYLVAPMKNLDIYMARENFKISDISHSPALMNVISLLSTFGLSKSYSTEMFYNKVNGYGIGNAYTTYYAYLLGFGYMGVVVFVIFNAMVLRMLYQRIRTQRNPNEISICLITYSFLLVNTMFSFFSDFFIISILSTGFIWQLLTWNVLKWFMNKEFIFSDRKMEERRTLI